MYKLTDWNDDEIKGIFYGSELNRVDKDADSLFYIDKILKRRQRGGKTAVVRKLGKDTRRP